MTYRAGATYVEGTEASHYLFFYKKAHPLSNFHPAPFAAEGHFFHTAEQYIMWHKALAFADLACAQAILQAATPAECKELGGQIVGFTLEGWAEVREQVAHAAVGLKFRSNPHLQDFLLGTGNLILAEASPTDRIWGIGYDAEQAWENRHDWGENLLGRALMQLREQLRQEATHTLRP